MHKPERRCCCWPAKHHGSGNAEFGREIGLALFIKFCLLGLVWWSFFAGRKVPVDSGSVARVMLDEPAVQVNHLQENR
ncbi:MAG: cytochrome oxidase putative small subunit CydP [Gammaproteobacteria bacterium]